MNFYYKDKFNAKDSGLIFSITILTLIIMSFIINLFVLPIVIVLFKSDFATYLSLILTQATFFMTAVIYCKINKINLFRAINLNRPFDKKHLKFTVLTGCTMIFALIIPAYAFIELLKLLGLKEASSSFGSSNSVFSLILNLFFIAVLPAICEELIFRGIILQGLRRFGDMFAIIASAALFMLMHENPEQTLFPFLSGIVMGFVFVKTGNIKYTMIIHFLNNAISVLTDFIYNVSGANLPTIFLELNIIDLILIAVGTVAFIFAMLHFFKIRTNYNAELQPKIIKLFYNPYIWFNSYNMPYGNMQSNRYNPYMNNQQQNYNQYNPYINNQQNINRQNNNTQNNQDINNGQNNTQFNPYINNQQNINRQNNNTQNNQDINNGQNNTQFNPYINNQQNINRQDNNQQNINRQDNNIQNNQNNNTNNQQQNFNQFNPYINNQPNTQYNPYINNQPNTQYNPYINNQQINLEQQGYFFNPKNGAYYLPDAADIPLEIPQQFTDVSKDARINPYYTSKKAFVLYSLFGIIVSIAFWLIIFFS